MQFPVFWPNVILFYNVSLSLSLPLPTKSKPGTRDERFTDASEFHHAGLCSAYLLFPILSGAVPIICDQLRSSPRFFNF